MVSNDCATYTLGSETFTSKHQISHNACKQVYVQVLNDTTYKFTTIPKSLNPFKADLSRNGQFYLLHIEPVNLATAHTLLIRLASQNRVRVQIVVYNSIITITRNSQQGVSLDLAKTLLADRQMPGLPPPTGYGSSVTGPK